MKVGGQKRDQVVWGRATEEHMHRDKKYKKVVVVGGPLDWWEGSSQGGHCAEGVWRLTSWTWQCEMCPTLSAIYFTCSVS